MEKIIESYKELFAEAPELKTYFKAILIALAVVVVAAVLFIILVAILKRVKHYRKKKSLMTDCEKNYYNAIKELCGDNYTVIPQVNLLSVIEKRGKGYRNELFRNVDFGIFDEDFAPILLIEVNDRSHERRDRKERDKSVNKICRKAKLPLLTLSVKDGFDMHSLKNTLSKYLKKL